MLDKPSNGDGIEELAPDWFAVRLSLLPNNTFHVGPPDYKTYIIVSPIYVSM